jgi:hypothetical protein
MTTELPDAPLSLTQKQKSENSSSHWINKVSVPVASLQLAALLQLQPPLATGEA